MKGTPAMPFRSFFRQFNVFGILLMIAGAAFALRLVNIVTFGNDRPVAGIGVIMPATAKDQISAVGEEPPRLPAAALDEQSIEKAVRDTALAVEQGGTATAPAEGAGTIQPPSGAAPPNYSQSRSFSASEIDVLQSLSQRRDALDKREQTLSEREALLSAAGQEVDRKIAELNKIRGELETLLDKQQTEQNDRIASLVKIYEGMKPKEAAAIFDTLDMDVLLSVIGRMNERKSSPILASMSPEKARLVTIRLAEQKQLPALPQTSTAKSAEGAGTDAPLP